MTATSSDPGASAAAAVSRRKVLGLAAATGAGVALGSMPTGSAAAAEAVPRLRLPTGGELMRTYTESMTAADAFLQAATDAYATGTEPRLAQSYSDEAGLFSTAFVYDNALAIIASLLGGAGGGGSAGLRRAQVLGDGLLYAQENDPVYDDGRLRQAYNVGPYTFYDGSLQPHRFVLPDGSANIGSQFGFLGTAVGDMAWPGMALLWLAQRTGDRRYLEGALRIARWIVEFAFSEQALGGYRFGVDAGNNPVPVSATEHNIDVYSFLMMLARATGDRTWLPLAQHAREFVERMWEPSGGYFYTGTNDGVEINRYPIPLDPQTWGWLSLRDPEYAEALDWAGSHLRVLDTPLRPNSTLSGNYSVSGLTFSTASLAADEDAPIAPSPPEPNQDGVWLEGTAHQVAALLDRSRRGDDLAAVLLFDEIRSAQEHLGDGQHLGGTLAPAGGIVAASSPLATGFGFGYYPYLHVGATSWHLIGGHGANPFRLPRH